MIQDFLHEIEPHFFKEYPREACGVLAVQKGKAKWFPCTNIAEGNDDFIIDSTEYLKIKATSDIIGIVHSHPDGTSDPSPFDISYCNALGIPYYIFSYPGLDLTVLEPEDNFTELYGREYEFGVQDCFEAMRDYLKTQNINISKRAAFEDFWFEKDLDYFTPSVIKEWGLEEVDVQDTQKNDMLTFKVNSVVANHCGVYLGNDVMYHHGRNRLSCRENMYPLWIKYLDRAYRYVA